MFRRLLPVFLLTLAACATAPTLGAYNQAAPAYMPVRPPPAYTPGFAPGTPAEPVYTPNGAGLPGERVPGTVERSVPRSPNKRILPPTKEPGLWAADAVRAHWIDVPVLGVDLSFNTNGTTSHEVKKVKACSAAVDTLEFSPYASDVSSLKRQELQCLAAELLRVCLTKEYAKDVAAGQATPGAKLLKEAAEQHAKSLCPEAAMTGGLQWLMPRVTPIIERLNIRVNP